MDFSKGITCKIDEGDLSEKPGWIRISIHPTMTDQEVDYIIEAVKQLAAHHKKWSIDYTYDTHTNEYTTQKSNKETQHMVASWFDNIS
jgi:predicted SAM-dependent methyltransferase